MATSKNKRMTIREKEERNLIKKRLQEKGVLPPNKPRLNRKKFAEEVNHEWKEFSLGNTRQLLAFQMVLAMMTNSGQYRNISKEDLGILKLKKCAIVLYAALENEKNLTIEEMADLLKPIWDL